jgi:DNA gyrase subunit B
MFFITHYHTLVTSCSLSRRKVGTPTEASENQKVEEGDESTSEECTGENIKGINIQRYKGLGEMNPEQLWETTMDPQNRVLLRVTIDDAVMADSVFDMLMGKEVLPRKKFIQSSAKNVKNLDI